jgi:2-iminobutanoate/2-iminopropanoate deaminase
VKRLQPQGGPHASGAYTPGIAAGGFVFVSGQGPLDPATGAIVGTTIAEQTAATLANVERVLAAADARLADVVRVDAYLADMTDFGAYDEAFRRAFGADLPTRTTVEAGLGGILVEISAVAFRATE